VTGGRVLAAASIACGVFIVATNALQEVARNGLGPAIITSLIFLVPLVFVPLAFLFLGSRVGMPEQSNAADSR
jgi:drug/metabolite transporter (DMT)-like permease